MGRTFPSTGVLLFRWSVGLSAAAGAAGVAGTASAAPVTFDDILRNCSSAAQIIGQGVTKKDEHLFTDSATGDWGATSVSHVDAFAGSGPVDGYSDQLSTVNPDVIAFMGTVILMGTSILTPGLSADSMGGTFLSVFFTVSEPVSFTRAVTGSTTGLFLHEEAPFSEISEWTGVLAPGKYSINATVSRRLDTNGAGTNFGTMRLEFAAVPGPGGLAVAGLAVMAAGRRRRR